MRSRRLLVPVGGSLVVAALCWALPTSGQVAGQAPAPAPGATKEGAPAAVAGLSTKFRFTERYERGGDRTRPDALDQYRVASRDVLRAVTEKAQGAPERQERTRQSIYAERPVQVSSA